MGDLRLYDGALLRNVHEADECALEHCCIHNPSDHPLNTAPYMWMDPLRAMFRVCDHGLPHPDPDDRDFMLQGWRWADAEAIASVHLMKGRCDGCCQKGTAT